MKQYKFTAKVNDSIFYPKGFYYQGKHVILVGCTKINHTIRQKFLISEVEITIEQ